MDRGETASGGDRVGAEGWSVYCGLEYTQQSLYEHEIRAFST